MGNSASAEILCDFGKEIRGIATDVEDNIFVANYYNDSIDKVSLNNGKVSIIQSTKISYPRALAINSKNEIYIGKEGEIMKMTKEGIISSIAGNGWTREFADGIGKSAKIGDVDGICFDENDIAYFCDNYNFATKRSLIRKLTPNRKVTSAYGDVRGNSDGKGLAGIVYNPSTKLFYITDSDNKSIHTMTVDGNVNTLCKYSDSLKAIAIDGEGKLYVSTVKDYSGEGELITVDSKGEIKQMNISVKWCRGLAFNSKGDLFFTSDNKLCVIRNCTKYPPHPIVAPLTNVNTKVINNNNPSISETKTPIMKSDEIDEMDEEAPPFKKFKVQKDDTPTTKKIKIIVECNKKLKLLEIESIPRDLETLNIKLRTLLGISTNEKIRVKYFDKSSSEFINLDKIEQIPTSECILRVFSSNSILSNIHSIEFSKLDFGTKDKSNWKKIGSGGYCDVFLATYSGIEVAVKTFKSSLIDSKEFQKEAKALSQVTHPNIIQLIGACIDPVPCLILEYMSGGSLSQIIKERKIGDRSKIGFALDIAAGLSFLHNEAKIIHHDIKPQNILVDNSLTIAKITDFGISKILDATTDGGNSTSNSFTAKYSAPEVLNEESDISSKCDIFSFAITLWEIFSESKPFPKSSIVQVIRKIAVKNERPSPMPNIPIQFIKLIEMCWKQDPKERPDILQVMEILKQVQVTILLKQAQNSNQETTSTYNIYVNKLKMDNPQMQLNNLNVKTLMN